MTQKKDPLAGFHGFSPSPLAGLAAAALAAKKRTTKKTPNTLGKFTPPHTNGRKINFRGYLGTAYQTFQALSGEQEPVVSAGYADWQEVRRPLRRAATVFTGYTATTMEVSVVFGLWDADGWNVDEAAGLAVEGDISKLEWMAGAHLGTGISPYVYVNSYGPDGASTGLVPYDYQNTSGVSGALADAALWPWVIHKGITWGKAWRGTHGNRHYQEATVSLMAFAGFQAPPKNDVSGGYFTSAAGRDDPLLIAGDPTSRALDVQSLARAITESPKNNPVTGTKLSLSGKSLRTHIPHGYRVWVPQHTG